MIGLLKKFAHREGDTEEITFSKLLILIISLSCCGCGIAWSSLYYFLLGFNFITALPLIFVLLVGTAIIAAHRLANHYILVYPQIACIFWIPVLIQWSFGSWHNAGMVLMWGFTAAIGAMIFLKRRAAFFWMTKFIIAILISIIYEPALLGYKVEITDLGRILFYMMNIIAPAIVVFAAAMYFLNGQINEKLKNIELRQLTEIKNSEITASINYAKRIQSAVLPPDSFLDDSFSDHFVLFRPRDIVSGDFYYFETTKKYTVIAAADCTGHGVPGAFMSMLGMAFLNEIIHKTEVFSAAEILEELREKVKKSLRQDTGDNLQKDGMDIALCLFDRENRQLHFSGAYNSLLLVRSTHFPADFSSDHSLKQIEKNDFSLFEIKADRQPVGVHLREKKFTNHLIDSRKGDKYYIFSDGYPDQTGGEIGKKFMIKKFKNKLLDIHRKPMKEQQKILDQTLTAWQGQEEQVDDILVIGIGL